MTNYLISINYKKSFQKNVGYGQWSKPVFLLVSEYTTREEFIQSVREFDEDLDIRTIRLIDEISPAKKGVQYLEGLNEEA